MLETLLTPAHVLYVWCFGFAAGATCLAGSRFAIEAGKLRRERDAALEKLADAYQFAGSAIYLLEDRISGEEAQRALDYFSEFNGPRDPDFLPWPREAQP